MNAHQRHSFVAAATRPEQSRWLSAALKDEGEVVIADQLSLERVRQILDLTGAQIVFVGIAPDTIRRDTALIEGLLTARPLLSVVALSDEPDQALVLSAMRAGARDFFTTDSRPGELVSLVHRLLSRVQVSNQPPPTTGVITALASARPGTDTPMLALHLALAMQGENGARDTLLLDLGTPAGDTLAFLGQTSSYSFIDAVRSLRRLDAMLIDSAFAKHESGLKILALPDEPGATGEITSADIYVLLGTLRRYFSNIVLNLGGVPRSDFLYLLLSNADSVLVVIEQSVPSCKQNMQLVRSMTEHKISMDSVGLVVDRYLPKLPPDVASISRGFDLPIHATLPPSGMARLSMMNSGDSLFECAPRDPYTVAVRKLADKITGRDARKAKRSFGARIRAWLKGERN